MRLPRDTGRVQRIRGGFPAQVRLQARLSSAESEARAYRGWEAKSERRAQRKSWPRRSMLFATFDRAPGCECLQPGLSVLPCSVLFLSPKTLSSLNLRDLESKFGSPFSE